MDGQEHIMNVDKRKIALLGDKYICRRFYLQFRQSLNIKYLFFTGSDSTDFLTDSFFKQHGEVSCMPLKASVIREQELLLILCIEHKYRIPYDDLLFNMGFEWGWDYVDLQYVIQYYRHKFNINIDKKSIWIFGAGNNGECFYETYQGTLSVQGFISNYENEQEYMGLPVIRPENIPVQENIFIVICSDADALMSEQLEKMGMIGGKEYCFPEMLPKKLFIAMGICQIMKTAEALNQNRIFCCQYQIDIYLQNAYESYHNADDKRLQKYGVFCDVVFYNVVNVGMTEFRNFQPLIDRYYQKAVPLFLPFYYFRGQLMQATDSVNPYAIKELKVYAGKHFWFRGDKEINHMVENDISEEEIIEKIVGDQYWTEREIKDYFQQELRRIEILDRFSSFPIKEYIEKNYQKILVFIDGVHFSWQLCTYLANEIAKRLEISPVEISEIINEGENSRTSIMPVYPCVSRALGMKRGSYYQYYHLGKEKMEYIDIKEYARRYIRFVRNIREICGGLGTVMAY